MITTNLTFGEWASVLGDARMTAALLNRRRIAAPAVWWLER